MDPNQGKLTGGIVDWYNDLDKKSANNQSPLHNFPKPKLTLFKYHC